MSERPGPGDSDRQVASDHASTAIEITAVTGIGELRPGDDLARLIVDQAPELRDGDVLVVTSKAISKVEGRLRPVADGDRERREQVRQQAIDDETTRVVARRGQLRIVQNRQGLVLAAAGVDESNVAADEIALLPVDPDGSAAALRDAIRARTGRSVAVVISDSMGRPWRTGLTDTAIGVAGISAIFDARGRVDSYGNELQVTEVAVVDELAAAADLVKGKLAGVPVAIVRGMARGGRLPDDGLGTKRLIRGADDDLFRLGTAEAIQLGRAEALGSSQPAPPLHHDAVATISSMQSRDDAEAALRHAYLGFLAARTDAMWRSCSAGHLTASAIVIDPRRQAVLLTLHPRVGRWLQLGGHCEPEDASLLAAAAREAREESGIEGLRLDPVPLELHVHPITCSLGVPTRHFDVRFLAVAPPNAEARRSEESVDLRWFDWADLPEQISPELPALLDRARARFGG
ncbi:MAG: coenzyme F420-0:L-glutamate ligase [Actinobacteria bacterium]|nr:coenzyme F420-0:L-glutamate ligase [Actinomycetota bacterium]